MKKTLLSLSFLFLCLWSVNAQEATWVIAKPQPKEYVVGKFWNNWFVSAGAGVNLYIGTYNQNLGEHLTPSIDISVGKWITPTFGLRLQYNGLSMSTMADKNYWYADKNTLGLTTLKFDYTAFHADLLMDFLPVVGGRELERVYRLIPFVGFGWAVSSKGEKTKNEFFVTAGLRNTFRVSPSFDLYCELRAAAVSQRLAGQMMGAQADFPLAATAGLTYHFGGDDARKFKVHRSAASDSELMQLNQRLFALAAANSRLQSENDELYQHLESHTSLSEPVVKPMQVQVAVSLPISFAPRQARLTKRDIGSLKSIAAQIKQHPFSQYLIKGYSDSLSSNRDADKDLSERRAQAVADALVEVYGVKPPSLVILKQGGAHHLFDASHLNRVAIVMAQ